MFYRQILSLFLLTRQWGIFLSSEPSLQTARQICTLFIQSNICNLNSVSLWMYLLWVSSFQQAQDMICSLCQEHALQILALVSSFGSVPGHKMFCLTLACFVYTSCVVVFNVTPSVYKQPHAFSFTYSTACVFLWSHILTFSCFCT